MIFPQCLPLSEVVCQTVSTLAGAPPLHGPAPIQSTASETRRKDHAVRYVVEARVQVQPALQRVETRPDRPGLPAVHCAILSRLNGDGVSANILFAPVPAQSYSFVDV